MRDADLTPTGRELKDPAATLIECVDGAGLKHTVIAFDEPYRGHSALTTGVDLIMSFMAYPMVTGLVECTAADTKRARFAYPTGTVWTVKEIARGFEQVGQSVGQRAALELCYLSGMVLHEAGETGPMQGCFSHGNLNPWRIGMKADGQLQIFGYGLAQVEMDRFLREEDPHIALDSIRYAPPERLERQPEQPSSDVYSLAVIALELMTGTSIYDETDAEKMWNAVKLAEGVQRIAKLKLPSSIQDVLGSALVYDPDRRLQGQAFVDAIGNLLDDPSIEGRTLAEVMDRMGNQGGTSKRKLVKAVGTAAFTPADLAALAAEEAASDPTDNADDTQSESRWSSMKGEATTGRRTSRRAVVKPVESRRAVVKPVDEKAPRRRTKSEAKKARAAKKASAAALAKETSPPETIAPPTSTPETAAPTETPRRRRRSASTPPPPPPNLASIAPEASQATAAPPDEPTPRRRRRRTEDTNDAASSPVDAAALADPVDDPPRRRRRRSAVQETPADPPPTRQRRRAKPLAPGDIPDQPVKSASADPDKPDTPPKAPGDAVAASEPRRRRRRRSNDDDAS